MYHSHSTVTVLILCFNGYTLQALLVTLHSRFLPLTTLEQCIDVAQINKSKGL
jgi:hypothetical protein